MKKLQLTTNDYENEKRVNEATIDIPDFLANDPKAMAIIVQVANTAMRTTTLAALGPDIHPDAIEGVPREIHDYDTSGTIYDDDDPRLTWHVAVDGESIKYNASINVDWPFDKPYGDTPDEIIECLKALNVRCINTD